MPGYGQSARPEWAREPRDLAILLLNQALDKLGLTGGLTLVGLGFGGFVAAEMATMDQRRLKTLVARRRAGHAAARRARSSTRCWSTSTNT